VKPPENGGKELERGFLMSGLQKRKGESIKEGD
jgi:hypothetical protein